jgi:arginine decarboxylase-like protein
VSLYELLTSGGGFLFAALTVIQIAPVKVNPWTRIARVIGSALNGEVLDSLNEEKANTRRYRILRFDDEIRHKVKHTEEHFNQIMEDVDYYEQYCKTHPKYENSKAVSAIKNVKQTWEKCKAENSFLV